MPDCNVEIKCKYGVLDACRWNVLIDGKKYSKVFNCSEDPDQVKQNAIDACQHDMIDPLWETGWRDDCADVTDLLKK